MNISYPDRIMLCFVQGFGDGEHGYNKNREFDALESNIKSKKRPKRVSLQLEDTFEVVPLDPKIKKSQGLVTGKCLKLTSGAKLPEVKRSLSDRFSVNTEPGGKRPAKGLLTIRKNW